MQTASISISSNSNHYTKKTSQHICVAERTSYFCLAHKLIWPLWSSHIFTQWGWFIQFSPNHFSWQHKNGENPPNTLFLRIFLTGQTHFLSSPSRSTTPCGKPSNLWTSWIYSLRPRVPSWTQIRCRESATHRNTFMPPLTFAMLTATHNSTQTSSYLNPGKHYQETFMPLPYNNQDHTFMGDYIFPVLKQQTQNLLHLWRCIIPLSI